MITITPEAAAQIRASARQAGIEKARLRLAARLGDGGVIEYGMGFDEAAEGDHAFESGDVTVLVSPGCIELLTGATLDYVEINPGEQRFIFINPNDPAHKPPKAAGPKRIE
jgi:iron-sulfur cluster assembly protein